jgi:hypothetical protein
MFLNVIYEYFFLLHVIHIYYCRYKIQHTAFYRVPQAYLRLRHARMSKCTILPLLLKLYREKRRKVTGEKYHRVVLSIIVVKTVKLSMLEAVEAPRLARGRGSHIS